MEKKKRNGIKNFFAGKGFLIATLMGIAAVGVSTFIAYDQAISKIGTGVKPPSTTDVITFTEGVKTTEAAPVENIRTDIPKLPDTTVTAPEIINVPDDEEAGKIIQKPDKKIMPVEGEIINGYSNGELVKSKTLNVWKTHDGIDIAAENGTQVLSVWKGKVTEVIDDPLWGTVVLVDYGDGVTGHYCGLDKNVSVTVGSELKTGEQIGVAGNTAQIEIAEAPHIHFGVSQNGNWLDPITYIGK
ncbi:MAG: M23 family metallopeptidase [Oscillospiraceae bacterium]|jgi:murein DD-endopeptidase MepM/ murein hydrolase activator NlpD|nr:M23 family metallopeptidase [Oscillospiraceae bacterium]